MHVHKMLFLYWTYRVLGIFGVRSCFHLPVNSKQVFWNYLTFQILFTLWLTVRWRFTPSCCGPQLATLCLFTLGWAAERWSCRFSVWMSSFIPQSPLLKTPGWAGSVWDGEEEWKVGEVGRSHVVFCCGFGYGKGSEGVRVWMGRQCDRQLPFVRKTQKAGCWTEVFFPFFPFVWNICLWDWEVFSHG